jgi:hypothetical protein
LGRPESVLHDQNVWNQQGIFRKATASMRACGRGGQEEHEAGAGGAAGDERARRQRLPRGVPARQRRGLLHLPPRGAVAGQAAAVQQQRARRKRQPLAHRAANAHKESLPSASLLLLSHPGILLTTMQLHKRI